jgi:UDP-N-acetylmuramoylalanine--D-glutamate ligase
MSDARLDLDGSNLVVGLGKTGLSMVRALCTLGAEVVVTDSRAHPPGLAEVQQQYPDLICQVGEFVPAAFERATRLWVSPGVSVHTPVIAATRARGVPVGGDIELFARLARAPVAAITGSNGKSTVTTLLGQMAAQAGVRVAVGGNLGTPALDLLTQLEPELYVLELSSFQLETTFSLNARVATVLNLSPDHLDWHGSLDEYVAAKRCVFRGDGWQVVNADDPAVLAMIEPRRPVLRFTLNEPADGEFGLRRRGNEVWLARGEEDWLAAAALPISGAHNLANALAALALGQALGLERTAMLTALAAFTGLPHRTQRVLEQGGVRWFDDSKGTNVGATVAAVGGMPGPVILIAGGDGKGQDFGPLAPVLAERARALVLIGRDAPRIEAAVAGRVPVHRAATMAQAVAVAGRLAQPGDCVLLSPACASFDMFRNYEERGAVFAAAVRSQAQ